MRALRGDVHPGSCCRPAVPGAEDRGKTKGKGARERGERVGSLLHYNSINGFEAALNARSFVGRSSVRY